MAENQTYCGQCGLTPDIEISLDDSGEDVQLDRAIEFLQSSVTP